MITKLVGRLQHLKMWKNVYYYSKNDDGKDRGKSGFFAKKAKDDGDVLKENPFKRKKQNNKHNIYSREALNRLPLK